MPTHVEDIASADVHKQIQKLIHELVNIKDKTGEFLMTLADGQVIDTKGWNDWEWTHGIGLYGIWKYYELTDDPQWLKIIEDWFEARLFKESQVRRLDGAQECLRSGVLVGPEQASVVQR